MAIGKYVQYGCGWCAPKLWINFDASPTLLFERLPLIGHFYTKNEARFPKNVAYGDIVKGLPVENDSCSAVYCSHVLEHLSLQDFRKALMNTFRILCEGGIFRFVVPDLEYFILQYTHDRSHLAALTFMRETHLGREKRNWGVMDFLTEYLGNSRHLWMWDYKAISHELSLAGFVGIRKAKFGDSTDPMFGAVEDEKRWEYALGVECNRKSV